MKALPLYLIANKNFKNFKTQWNLSLRTPQIKETSQLKGKELWSQQVHLTARKTFASKLGSYIGDTTVL